MRYGRAVRARNTSVALAHAILARGPAARNHADLAAFAGISPRTVDNVLRILAPPRLMTRERPPRLGPGLGLVVGVSLGTESLRSGLLSPNGDLLHARTFPPMAEQLARPPNVILARVRRAVFASLQDALDDAGLRLADGSVRLRGVGVAWPAPVDNDGRPAGSVLSHRGWRDPVDGQGERRSLEARLAEVLRPVVPHELVHALNDANAHGLALAFDHSRERAAEGRTGPAAPAGPQAAVAARADAWRQMIVVRLGGGVGASTVQLAPEGDPDAPSRSAFLDTGLIVGGDGLAGEIGHLPIDRGVIAAVNRGAPRGLRPLEPDAPCPCGGRSHLEAYVGASAFARRMSESGFRDVYDDEGRASPFVTTMFREGPDEIQKGALRQAGRLLGHALAGPILMLNPQRVALTGALAGGNVREGLESERELWKGLGGTIRLSHVSGEARVYAGVRGAALAVMRAALWRRMGEALAAPDLGTARVRPGEVPADT